MRTPSLHAAALTAALLLDSTAAWPAPPPPSPGRDAAAVSPDPGVTGASREAWAAAAALSRGINLSVYAAPREGDWGLSMDERWIDAVAKAGFRSVRISVRWSNHAAAGPDALLEEVFARRIDQVVDAFLAHGMRVVLTACFYSQLDGQPLQEGERPVAPSVVQARFVNLWRQLSRRYAGRSDRLLFELYSAPRISAPDWNRLAGDTLKAIRADNPRRMVVLGPRGYDAQALAQLNLPHDDHLIVTIHNHEPRTFTSQGLPWFEGSDKWVGTPCCDAGQLEAMTQGLEVARAWSLRHRYPVWLGLFSATSGARLEDRARYLRAVRDAAEARGMAWAHADFPTNFNVRNPPQDAGLYDVVQRTWHPRLLDALLGP